MKLRGKEKTRQIDEFDGESKFGNTTLWPGQIYAYIYKASRPSLYDDGNVRFQWYDSLPIVLVTHVSGKYVRGINLNLCNMGLRAYVLNALWNLDQEFYKKGAMKMTEKGTAPISNNVAKIFLSDELEKKFLDHITMTCKLRNTDMIYRTYNTEKIKDIRMLEVWQYKYIPFLEYTGDLKQEILKTIWSVTGVDKVVI